MRLSDILNLHDQMQGYKNKTQVMKWFKTLDNKKKLEVLRTLFNFAIQANANLNDIKTAIEKSGLKQTYTPCVLLKKEHLPAQISKILKLPACEHEKIFILAVELLRIADNRRQKEVCKGKCTHWWHIKTDILTNKELEL
jgi:hypothetical protein